MARNFPLTTLLFDNDGVLVDTEYLYYLANREILGDQGIDLTEELFVEYFMRQGSGVWHLLQKKGYSQSKIEFLRDRRNDRYFEMLCNGNLLIEGVRETLAALHNRFTMGIVTSSRKSHFMAAHRDSGILGYFSFTLTREDYTNSKPDPEPYLRGLRLAGASADESMVIEDSERGLQAADAAGIRCVVIPNGLTVDGDFSGAFKILKSIKELPGILA